MLISEPNEEVIKILLSHGADPNYAGHDDGYAFTYESGYTRNNILFPLMASAARGYCFLVKLLLEAGADSNKTNSIGQSVLHVCHRSYQIEILKSLLSYNGDVNLRDDSGRTPLHCACASSPVA